MPQASLIEILKKRQKNRSTNRHRHAWKIRRQNQKSGVRTSWATARTS